MQLIKRPSLLKGRFCVQHIGVKRSVGKSGTSYFIHDNEVVPIRFKNPVGRGPGTALCHIRHPGSILSGILICIM